MKKRNSKIQSLSLPGSKVVASDYGPLSRNKIATGDQRNNLILWQVGYQDPLQISQTIRTDSAISSLKFTSQQRQLLIGSSRGVINVWDLQTSRSKLTLKGHTINVTSMTVSQRNPNFIASGAYDTKVKLWDMRTRNNIGTLKSHSMQINCMQMSPDSQYLVSGSKDCSAKLWDLKYGNRILHSFNQHEAPINCIKFNPDRRLFTTGGNDRVSRQWQLGDIYACLSITKVQTTPVTALLYTLDGQMIFTCSNDSLKLWNFQQKIQAALLDNIESSWKNVQHLFFNSKNSSLLGLAYAGKDFSVFQCPLSSISFDGKRSSSKVIQGPAPQHSNINQKQYKNQGFPLGIDLGNLKDIAMKVQNVVDGAMKNLKKQKQQRHDQQQRRHQQQKKRQQQKKKQLDKKRQRQLKQKERQERQRLQKLQRNRLREQQKQEMRLQKQQLNKRQKQIRDRQLLILKKQSSAQQPGQTSAYQEDPCDMTSSINFSKLCDASSKNKQLYQQFDIIRQIAAKHSSFQSIIQMRITLMKSLLDWWKSGNLKQTMKAFNMMEDVGVIADFLRIILVPQFRGFNCQIAKQILPKIVILIQHQNVTYIKYGIVHATYVVDKIRDQIIQSLTFSPMGGAVDLARDSRIQQYKLLFNILKNLYAHKRMSKIIKRQNQSQGKAQVAKLCRILLDDLQYIFLKVQKK